MKRPAARILVIDDDPTLCRALQRILVSGYDVTCATSPQEALSALSSRPFDAILCDVHVAGFDGIQLGAQIVDRDPRYFGNILFMSGAILSEAQRREIVSREHSSIAKPFTPDDLLRALARIAPPQPGLDAA